MSEAEARIAVVALRFREATIDDIPRMQTLGGTYDRRVSNNLSNLAWTAESKPKSEIHVR